MLILRISKGSGPIGSGIQEYGPYRNIVYISCGSDNISLWITIKDTGTDQHFQGEYVE